jgi:uncharacterized damage-inducible protein DinB
MTIAPGLMGLLHKAYHGPAWHGPAVGELLADVTAEQAAALPALGSHSIWALVLHITVWKEEVCRRLSGPSRELTPEENWPPIADTSEASWRASLDRLDASQRALEDATARLSDDQMLAPAVDATRPPEKLVHAIIHHDLYHAGQIALLKTRTRGKSVPR